MNSVRGKFKGEGKTVRLVACERERVRMLVTAYFWFTGGFLAVAKFRPKPPGTLKARAQRITFVCPLPISSLHLLPLSQRWERERERKKIPATLFFKYAKLISPQDMVTALLP